MVERYVQGFLLHRESDGRSRKTLSWHNDSLMLFVRWLRETNQSENPSEWTPTLIRAYFVYLRERKSKNGQTLSPTSVRTYASSVLAFCRWLFEEEVISKNIVERVASPKVPMLVKAPFETHEIKKLLAAAKSDSRNGLRDYALVLFLLDSGCRASEVVTLKAEDIMWNQRIAKVYGKGAKERVVFFSAETAKAMLRYQMKSPKACACFFCSEENRPFTASALLQMLKRLGRKANVTHANPHRFRHTFAITFLRSGGNVIALQRILGHSTLTMTTKYLAMVSDDLAREHVAHSPVQFMLK